MMNDEFVAAIREGFDRGLTLIEFLPILREFRDRGMTAKTAEELLMGMLVGADEAFDDLVRDLTDNVCGFCSPHVQVWPTPAN